MPESLQNWLLAGRRHAHELLVKLAGIMGRIDRNYPQSGCLLPLPDHYAPPDNDEAAN
jgi:hypothetical protein